MNEIREAYNADYRIDFDCEFVISPERCVGEEVHDNKELQRQEADYESGSEGCDARETR